MATNVPSIQFTQTGLVLPSEQEILEGVQTDLNEAFGGNLNPGLSTPQGQLAVAETAVIGNTNDLFAYYVNQVNPDFAEGAMQDAVCRIYFLNRKPGSPSTVSCQCMGLAGTLIPVGAQAQSADGTIYNCIQQGTIGQSGTITLQFEASVNGPTPVPANSVNVIYRSITGWDRVDNQFAGVVGSLPESRAEFAYRRQQSVALNAHGSLPSIYASVFEVPDVVDVYVTENVTSAPIDVGSTNYTLAPHSLYVAASGGDPAAIANAIWLKKDVGCDYNGNTTVTVYDESGYLYPYPSYEVTFEIPPAAPTFITVRLTNNPALPASIVGLVREAVYNSFYGLDDSQRTRIGSNLYASSFYGAVSRIGNAVEILSIKIGLTSPGAGDSILYGIDQAPTLEKTDITVTLV